jgi:hypothetical protein
MGALSQEDKDSLFDDLFSISNLADGCDSADKILETPTLTIDLDSVNNEAQKQAMIITERLSNYYFDQKYIDNHPYIPSKIMQEMDNIRRLLKMLVVNEKAQDVLIQSITMNMGKGTLYTNLTSLQTSMLNIQNQLNNLTTQLENIFKEMQAECEKTFEEKPKEQSLEDGSMIVRGSKEFIKALNEQLYGTNQVATNGTEETTDEVPANVDSETGEILDTNPNEIEGEATYADIVAM